jgi:hypothetical protein
MPADDPREPAAAREQTDGIGVRRPEAAPMARADRRDSRLYRQWSGADRRRTPCRSGGPAASQRRHDVATGPLMETSTLD